MATDTRFKGSFKRAALFIALGACFSGAVHAQSNATGSIFGSSAAPGTSIVIRNLDTGLVREVSIDANGRYSASALPVGRYSVSAVQDGQTVAIREDVLVRLGAGSEVSFAGAMGDSATLDAVVVAAGGSAKPIDVSSVDTRVVFTAEQLKRIPVGRSIEAIALLTPGVVAADSRYGNSASFGGSSASENAIYINGYPVTNPLTAIGSTTLPFDGIDQFQAYIGGYGAEFGRATGGVVNIITKRGSNEWKHGAQVVWSPQSLRGEQRSIFYPDDTGNSTDGLLYQNLADRQDGYSTYALYSGGPIIQDRLFVYASAEYTDRDIESIAARTATPRTAFTESTLRSPRWLAKLDWNINDNHRVEFTGISDKTKQTSDYFAYSYNDFARGDTQNGGYYYEDGGELYIGSYTGYLTDNITLSAVYGKQDQVHIATPWGYDPSLVYVSDNRGTANPVTGLQPYGSLSRPDAADETSGGRLDLEWVIGDHSLRFGYDRHDSRSIAGTMDSGPGYRWIYHNTDTPDDPIPASGGARGPGGNGDYVEKYIYQNGGEFEVKQEAQYIEDRWQVSDNWLLSLGLRNEQFSNYNADGIVYVSQRHQLAPRLGVSWDVKGDSSLKVFANAGRYHLALPNNVARRGAAGSLYTHEYFAFQSIDPNSGVPIGLTALGDAPYSPNNEYGNAPDPRMVAAEGLKSHFQDEFVLGFEQQLGGFNYGTRFVYRDLKSAIDDICDGRAAEAWGLANGLSEDQSYHLGQSLQGCRLFNPGEDNTFNLDDGSGTLIRVPLTADALGFDKLKRRYYALDFFVERPFDGTWYAKIDYTWSKNYGNSEGQLLSDFGQADVAMTMTWDHPELMLHGSGYLPNDRTHFLKAFGFYQISPEWRVAATVKAATGRPKNCYGYLVDGSAYYDENMAYGAYYHFCNGQASPRGTAGRLPDTATIDLGLAYAPNVLDNRLVFSLDVFNIFDQQVAQSVEERWESGGYGTRYAHSGRVINYSSPRSVRLAVRYDF